MNNESKADIRNKLQVAVTALESIKKDKSISKMMVDSALRDLEKVLEIIGQEEIK